MPLRAAPQRRPDPKTRNPAENKKMTVFRAREASQRLPRPRGIENVSISARTEPYEPDSDHFSCFSSIFCNVNTLYNVHTLHSVSLWHTHSVPVWHTQCPSVEHTQSCAGGRRAVREQLQPHWIPQAPSHPHPKLLTRAAGGLRGQLMPN